MIVSSGGVCHKYQVLGLVVGFASKTEGCGTGTPVEEVYHLALKRLKEAAIQKGASGLLFVNFQNRVAVSNGCTGPKQAFEVFAWGTAVSWV